MDHQCCPIIIQCMLSLLPSQMVFSCFSFTLEFLTHFPPFLFRGNDRWFLFAKREWEKKKVFKTEHLQFHIGLLLCLYVLTPSCYYEGIFHASLRTLALCVFYIPVLSAPQRIPSPSVSFLHYQYFILYYILVVPHYHTKVYFPPQMILVPIMSFQLKASSGSAFYLVLKLKCGPQTLQVLGFLIPLTALLLISLLFYLPWQLSLFWSWTAEAIPALGPLLFTLLERFSPYFHIPPSSFL